MDNVKIDFRVIYPNVVSDNDIVPDDYQNALLYWRDTFSRGYFSIGDIANELCELSLLKDLPVTQQRIFDAVGKFCGKSGRTVRYYAETSSFYPSKVRDEYEELPFSHFVFAKTLNDEWKDVLDFAKLSPHCSVEYLRRNFCFDQKESVCAPKTVCSWQTQNSELEKNLEKKIFLDEPRQNFLRADWLADLNDLVDRLSKMVEWEDRLDLHTKDELTVCLATLRKFIPVLAQTLANKRQCE